MDYYRGRGRGRGRGNIKSTQYKNNKNNDEVPSIDYEIVPKFGEIADIGLNLAHKSFSNDLEKILERSKEKNVTLLILTGTSEKSTIDCCKKILFLNKFFS